MRPISFRPAVPGVSMAIGAAVLFGVSTPLSKILLAGMDPVLLAGLLYLGSGCGLALVWVVRKALYPDREKRDASLKRVDLPWLLGAILAGGVAGPILLMAGLKATAASSASLLLNLEGVFTATLAWFVFRENFDRRIFLGMIAISAGCVILSWSGEDIFPVTPGSLSIAAACLAWGIDNNLTCKVSAGDPLQVAAAKGLAAGAVNTLLAFCLGPGHPIPSAVLAASLVGFVGYGLSLVLFVLALRHLGTSRTGAYFSLAPFVGAAVSILVLGDKVTVLFLVGAVLMGIGVMLHLTERHGHDHVHAAIPHDHNHRHDEHHEHEHEHEILTSKEAAHCHPHTHCKLIHSHPHYPDIHHRHGH